MTTCSFDTLLISLQHAVVDANASMRRRRLALFAAGETSTTSEHALQVDIPQSPATDAPCVPLTLPLSMFRARRMPHIAMLSVEFDCSLRFRKQRGHAEPQLQLYVGKPRFPWLRRRTLHHLRISYLSTNAWQPQVEMDGRALVIPPIAQAAGG